MTIEKPAIPADNRKGSFRPILWKDAAARILARTNVQESCIHGHSRKPTSSNGALVNGRQAPEGCRDEPTELFNKIGQAQKQGLL